MTPKTDSRRCYCLDSPYPGLVQDEQDCRVFHPCPVCSPGAAPDAEVIDLSGGIGDREVEVVEIIRDVCAEAAEEATRGGIPAHDRAAGKRVRSLTTDEILERVRARL